MTKIEPIEIHWPEYHSSAMGCGLEDRGIHNRYDAMLHGWERAIERCMEAVPDEPIVLASDVDKVLAAKDAEIARLLAAITNAVTSASDAYRRPADAHSGWERVWIVPLGVFDGLRTAGQATTEEALRKQVIDDPVPSQPSTDDALLQFWTQMVGRPYTLFTGYTHDDRPEVRISFDTVDDRTLFVDGLYGARNVIDPVLAGRAEMLRKIESVLNIPSAGHASAGELADTILDALGCTEGSTDA